MKITIEHAAEELTMGVIEQFTREEIFEYIYPNEEDLEIIGKEIYN